MTSDMVVRSMAAMVSAPTCLNYGGREHWYIRLATVLLQLICSVALVGPQTARRYAIRQLCVSQRRPSVRNRSCRFRNSGKSTSGLATRRHFQNRSPPLTAIAFSKMGAEIPTAGETLGSAFHICKKNKAKTK